MVQLRRGDAIALVSALMIVIFSFLAQTRGYGYGATNLWHRGTLLQVFLIPLLALVAAAQTIFRAGLEQKATWRAASALQWRVAAAGLVAFSAVLTLISIDAAAYGAIIDTCFGLLLLAGVLATEVVPPLLAPLTVSIPKRPATRARPEEGPFWAAFPTTRPAYSLEVTGQEEASVRDDDWYLVIGRRDGGVIVRLDDGREVVVRDGGDLIRG